MESKYDICSKFIISNSLIPQNQNRIITEFSTNLIIFFTFDFQLHRSYSNQPDVKINPVNNPFKICNFLNSTKSKFQSDVKINTVINLFRIYNFKFLKIDNEFCTNLKKILVVFFTSSPTPAPTITAVNLTPNLTVPPPVSNLILLVRFPSGQPNSLTQTHCLKGFRTRWHAACQIRKI